MEDGKAFPQVKILYPVPGLPLSMRDPVPGRTDGDRKEGLHAPWKYCTLCRYHPDLYLHSAYDKAG